MTREEWETAQAKLITDCPLLFRNHDGTPPSFYFEFGRGWHSVVRKLCLGLEKIAEGIEAPSDELEPDLRPRALQIKEKFGGLRFYFDGERDMAGVLVGLAEDECWKTCEVCGEPGVTRRNSYIQTLCDTHYEKDEEE